MDHIRLANNADRTSILKLYRSLIGTKGCTWHKEYPSMEIIKDDILHQSLYCLCNQKKEIVAVATLKETNDFTQEFWDKTIQKPCELSRVGVKKPFHNKGYGYHLLMYVMDEAKKQGFDGIQLLVSEDHMAAKKLYEKLGFDCCGKTHMYDQDWACYEKKLR